MGKAKAVGPTLVPKNQPAPAPEAKAAQALQADGKSAHKTWSGSIIIGGGINVPIQLYTASRAVGFSFNQLHGDKRRAHCEDHQQFHDDCEPCATAIGQYETIDVMGCADCEQEVDPENKCGCAKPKAKRVMKRIGVERVVCGNRLRQGPMRCLTCGVDVERTDIIRGYAVDEAAGKYIHISDDELKSAKPDGGKFMELLSFIPQDQVPPIYFESSYYVAPDDKMPRKIFNTLWKAMIQEKVVGFARVTASSRQNFVFLMPYEQDGKPGMLAFYAFMSDEIQQISFPAAVDVAEREVAMARKVIGAFSKDFNPSEFKDEYRANVGALLEAKMEGNEVPVIVQKKQPEAEFDLMTAMQATLTMLEQEKKKRA